MLGPEIAKFFQDFGERLLERVEMNFRASVVSFDEDAFTAVIRPLLFTNDESGNGKIVAVPDLKDVPVERTPGIKHRFLPGDLVTVKCFASAVLPLESKANMRLSRFQLSSVVVSGAVKLKTNEENYLWFDDTAANISGTLKVTTDVVLNGRSLAAHFIAYDSLVATYNLFFAAYGLHTHPIPGVTPGPGSTVSGPPT